LRGDGEEAGGRRKTRINGGKKHIDKSILMLTSGVLGLAWSQSALKTERGG